MPWAVSSSLSDDKLFVGPKHNINALFMILFGLYDSILLFVCQICHVNGETENWKQKKFIFITGEIRKKSCIEALLYRL